jgi:nitrite reductase/ring-hydroxylating ferredoxin subunit
MTFEHAVARDELWEGESRSMRLRGKRVLLVHLEDGFHAYADRCAHLGLPLGDAKLEGHVLACPAHGYRYDMRTGACENPKTACLTPYAVRVTKDAVLVDVPNEEPRS